MDSNSSPLAGLSPRRTSTSRFSTWTQRRRLQSPVENNVRVDLTAQCVVRVNGDDKEHVMDMDWQLGQVNSDSFVISLSFSSEIVTRMHDAAT